jgi:transcriptional regulator GlxA family with amidase domain
LHAWIAEHLTQDLSIDKLAAHANMSRRTFMRSYAAATGRTPAKTIEAMRLEAARVAIESTKKSFKQVSREVGFKDETRLRRAFQRQYGVSPGDYRGHFSLHGRVPDKAVKRSRAKGH